MRPRSVLALLCLVAPTGFAQGSLLDAYNHASVHALGASVSGLGDVNGDGYADLVVGAPGTFVGFAQVGAAFVISGQSGVAVKQFYGAAAKDRFGVSVAGVGDVDGDGCPDLAIGAPQDKEAALGYVQVRSGADGHLIHQLLEPPGFVADFGISVASAGDADADGWPDLVVGAGVYYAPGYVRLYSGATGALLLHINGQPTLPFESSGFGSAVSGLGDVDGDGHDDFVVGEPLDATFGWHTGSALVYSGRNGQLLHEFVGPHPNAELGNSVAGCGDVDGDGTGDVLVGAWGEAASADYSGAAHVYSGRDGSQIHLIPGEGYYDQFGQSVAGAGDVDGDGRPDLAISAAYSSTVTPYVSGNVYVHSGRDASLLSKLEGGDTAETAWHPPIVVAGVGDLNRNGHADVAVGLPEQTPPSILLASELHVFELGCGTIEDFGAGCAGTLGAEPLLAVGGCAAPACTLLVTVSGVPVPADVLLLIGLSPADVPLSGKCSLLVASVVAPVLLPSTHTLEAELPLQSLGLAFTLQAFAFGRGAPGGMAASQGVQVSVD